jgi:hypothetical protein
MVEFQGDRPGGFQGTAYVDLYLRHEPKGKPTSKENQAAVKEVQTRLLRKLTAKDFSLVFAFTSTAGLVGYIDDVGLAKLVEDPAVVAIGLDDQARPDEPPIALRQSRPPTKHGERPPPTEKIGKVEAEVYNALKNSTDGYVFVIVSVTDVPLGPGPFQEADKAKQATLRALENRVLSALSAEEFKCRGRCYGPDGYVNAGGLAKLADHPDVDGVGLDEAVRFFGDVKKSHR